MYDNITYATIVFLSTSFSVLYHYTNEANLVIMIIDYILAGVWFITDLYYGGVTRVYTILLCNGVIFCINISITKNENYKLHHSLWHLLNVTKCYYIATLISY